MVGRRWFMTALALVGLGAPMALSAQQQAVTPALSQEKLVELAKIYTELSAMRDAYHASTAAVHEPQAKDAAREEMEAQKADIFTKHGTTELEYEREIWVVSSDTDQRAAFERILKQGGTAQEEGS